MRRGQRNADGRGIKYGYTDFRDKKAKAEHYGLVQSLVKQFEKENGSFICRELLGLSKKHDNPTPLHRNENYYKKRPCAELVGQAAKILDEYIINNDAEGENITKSQLQAKMK